MSVLTAHSTIGVWLDDAKGGELIRGLLAQSGADAAQLDAMRGLTLQQLQEMSRGQMPQSVVDDLVRGANDGVIPEEPEAAGDFTVPGRFDGQTVIVTGAAGGIGRAVASRIVREGGRVVAVDISEDRLADLANESPAGTVVAVGADVTKQADLDRVIAAAGERIDGLANVAGVNDDFSPIHETSDEIWDRVIGINLTGVFKLTRAVVPAMLEAGSGSIVNVSSEAGLRGNASGNAYTVSKHGVIGLTRSAAFMYAKRGLRVNVVAPGGVATGIPFPKHVSEEGSARLQPFQSAIPSLASAEDLAASITFLLSRDAVNINGAVLPSDGGWSVQ